MKKILILAISLCCLWSCGGKSSSDKGEGKKTREEQKCIPGDQVELAGMHKGIVQVGDSVRLVLSCEDKKRDKWNIKVIVPLVSKYTHEDLLAEYGDNYELSFGNVSLVPLDQYDSEMKVSFSNDIDYDSFKELMNATSTDENVKGDFVLYSNNYPNDYRNTKEYFDKIENVKISRLELTRVYHVVSSASTNEESEEKEEETTAEETTAEDNSSASTSYSYTPSRSYNSSVEDEDEEEEEADEEEASQDDEDWDSILDDYEELIDKYIVLMKKANQGDISAMSEYPSLLSKAQKLSEKLDKAGDDLSYSQAKRFAEIAKKANEAVLNQ